MKEIFEVEKNREDVSQWNVIHLFREGSTYKAYEWSAWLCREHGATDEHLQQVGAKRLNPVHRNVKNTGGSVIFVGFPFASIDKFLPKTSQISFQPVDDNRIDIAIELPADQFGDNINYDALRQKFSEWKLAFPVKDEKKDKPSDGVSRSTETDELLALLAGSQAKPMRMSDIVAQLIALPVEDISPNDALKLLRILKRQAAALF
jgi:hypothetical protein